MGARTSIVKGGLIAIAATFATASALAAGPGGGGHAGGGGGHVGGGGHAAFGGGGYRGGYARGGFYGGYRGGYYGGYRGGYYGRPYYGGWHGYYGGYYGWGGWGGWGWGLPYVGLGLYLSTLPYGYSTYYWGGVPYYYANNNYYVYDSGAGQYEAVEPPSGLTNGGNASAPSGAPPGPNSSGKWTDLFAYPKGGQSTEQQAKDRNECHQWAVSQTGFDPAQPTQSSQQDWAQKREAYLRAEGACLEARNYSVK